MIMKILKKGGVVEKRGRRKRNPCPMRLCFNLEHEEKVCRVENWRLSLPCSRLKDKLSKFYRAENWRLSLRVLG
jgi:hypothetical protein